MKFIIVCLISLMYISCESDKKEKNPPVNDNDTIIAIVNGSFEGPGERWPDSWENTNGWDGSEGGVSNDGFYSPPDGVSFTYQKGPGDWISQETGETIQAGKTYKLKLWARSVNPEKIPDRTTIEAGFYYKTTEIKSQTLDVNAPFLKGEAASRPNDDGGNVWVDGAYRHSFAEFHLYQSIEDDPIMDPWELVPNDNYRQIDDLGWAVGQVIVGDEKYIYGTRYRDRAPNFYSSLTLTRVLSEDPPNYTWSEPVLVLDHDKTEFPWVLDAHGYYDEVTGKLWMSWGGGICYVSEMDPEDGMLISHPENKEFNTHPEGTHHPVATWPETREGWEGDQWSSSWNEGPALYKHKGYWYFLASYGNLGRNYTIRMGRGDSPTGPFYDKLGVDLMEFDEERNAYGNSMLLGAEGDQLVPGHPHIWEENGNFYMGYDYRKNSGEEMDYMGIRRLYWVNDWPTIWIPVEVSFSADDHPAAIGQKLGIRFRNTGEANSELGVDLISVEKK